MNRNAVQKTLDFLQKNPGRLEKFLLVTKDEEYNAKAITNLRKGKNINFENLNATLGVWIILLNQTDKDKKIESLEVRMETILDIPWLYASYLWEYKNWPLYLQRLNVDTAAIRILKTALIENSFIFLKES